MTTKPKLIVPKHVWDGQKKQKEKKELEKDSSTSRLENSFVSS